MRKAVAVLVVIASIVSIFMVGCAGGEGTKDLEMGRLQSDTGAFQYYDLAWESDPHTTQKSLGITFEQPDTAGNFQVYRSQNAYAWNNVAASISCEYEADKLYTVTLRFMPGETEREGFWSAIKEELFHLYGTVEGNVQSSTSEKLNITTETENYLWEDQSGKDTLMSLSKCNINGEFKYIALSVYVMR